MLSGSGGVSFGHVVGRLHATAMEPRRVVVTGIGMLCALGVGKDAVFRRLVEGERGVTAVRGPGYDGVPCRVAAYVPMGPAPGQLRLDDTFSPSEQKTMSVTTMYALIAAGEALNDAGWAPRRDEDRERTGVSFGLGMVDLEEIATTAATFKERGYSKVSPHFVPKILPNMPAGHIAIRFGLLGPNHAVSTACATGAHAIGDAARLVVHGDADVMVCGASDACIGPLMLAAFCRMRSLSTRFNAEPASASRPFDARRDGFVAGEGAAALVLEERAHALRRGARAYAELAGYGLSGDAYHTTAPLENGAGAARCMRAALVDARVAPADVAYVNAHATSTPAGDAAESRAVRQVFAPCERLAVSSTKGAVGHLLGAAGAIEAAFTALAVREAVLPPTANLERLGDGVERLDYVAIVGRDWKDGRDRRVALTNSFGFGGTNASLCFASA